MLFDRILRHRDYHEMNNKTKEKVNLLFFGIWSDGFKDAARYSAPFRKEKRKSVRQKPKSIDYNQIYSKVDMWLRKETNVREYFTIDDIANDCGIKRQHLVSFFREKLNKNFRKWRVEMKIAAAQTLLDRDHDSSVSDISDSVGFCSQSNFYRQFRRVSGMTPLQWRRRE